MHFLVGDCSELQLNPCITGWWTMFFFGGVVDKVKLALNPPELAGVLFPHHVALPRWDAGGGSH